MKFIEIKEFTPAPGTEYAFGSYPGQGAYLLPDGKLILAAAGITTCLMTGAFLLIKEGTPARDESMGPAPIDVHRLIDQVIELKK